MALDVINTAQSLIQIPSVTDAPNRQVSSAMCELLEGLNFDVVEHSYTDANGLDKRSISARRLAITDNTRPGIGYFCHNDVVSVEGWNCVAGGPFDANIAHDKLWGRGSCDMKGSAAAALSAISRVEQSEQDGPLYFFVTGDEESGMVGASLLATNSEFFGQLAQSEGLGIIGEPTSLQPVLSHKGACHLTISSSGVAAHSSTHDGKNANWELIPMLNFLAQLHHHCESEPELQNQAFDPATLSMNLVVENNPQMANITVGSASAKVFFRPMPGVPWESIASDIELEAKKHGLKCQRLQPLPPLHTDASRPLVSQLLSCLGNLEPQAVCYATDGCCFSTLKDLIVLGPGSIEQAHRPDEWITLDALHHGTKIYEQVFRQFATRL